MNGNGVADARLEHSYRSIKPDDIEFERIKSEEEDWVSAPPDYQINTYPADFTLEVLHSKWQKKEISIPDFQRQFVWKQNQASKLIESFLIGLPVPPVFLYTERTSQKFLVIDGQQRLRSVFYFFEGLFGAERKGRREVFSLKGLSEKSKYRDKTFEDLTADDNPDGRRLKNSVLRSFIVQQLDPLDDTSIYHVFERLNTGGTFLANQEIRNCVHRGEFNNLLHDLNKLPEWRLILGRPNPDSRQRDVELILRFFALLDVTHYTKPMKDFLTKFMAKNATPAAATLQKFRKLFSTTCLQVAKSLGERPFHIRAGLNAAMFDCVMVNFAHHLDSVPSNIRDRYNRLKQNQQFLELVSLATANDDVVSLRFATARTRLFGNEAAKGR